MFSTTFIAATKEYSSYQKNIPAPYIRKTFSIDKKIESAKITICGLGFYDLFINGKRITKGLIAPYISNPNDILYYDEYELTDSLLNGKNALGILLGNGFLNSCGGAIWNFHSASFRSAPKVALSLKIIYSDGETDIIEADESFKTHPSPILFDDLRCGEVYDANKAIAGWNMPDFDDSSWTNAILAETPGGETKLCTAEPIVTIKELTPVSIKKDIGVVFNQNIDEILVKEAGSRMPLPEEYKKGYLYDFGENLAGNISLKIKGEKGQTISIIFGELIDSDGNLDMRSMYFQPDSYDHRVVYTLNGDGVEEYTPTFTYQGFRYCLVSGITEQQAIKDLLTYKVMSSDLKKNGDVNCSDDIFNKLQKATYNSDISNFYYFPTDCPHREKNGWTADAALSAEQMLFNLTPENSYHVWLDNIRKAQRDDGALPGIVPTSGWGFDWGNGPAWDSVLFYLPYYTWINRGDTDIIRENAAAMLKYLKYVSTRRDEKGLLHIGLGDWMHIGYNSEMVALEVTDTLITMNVCSLASKMYEAIGLVEEKQVADELFNQLRMSARRELLMQDGVTVIGRTQTGQAMAVEYDLLDEDEKSGAVKVLLDIIHEADDHLDTGCLGAKIIFHVLAKYGYADLAYKMIVRPDYPSYGYWIVEQNATSLFEEFQKTLQWPTSKNHHFFGDISSWFFKYIVGVKINPNLSDYKEIEFSPNFIESLSFAEGYQNHCGEKVACKWERKADEYIVEITMPSGCYGKLIAPVGHGIAQDNRIDSSVILKPGVYTYRVKVI